ncbi:PTS sugar transporter subunit IIA [Falsibacillus albus]|uniref:PTS glucose transporter subunit IIA n=1 Tax=Falsibacillus albus TaxID=2478915 RepID=A0A3L7K1C6_9BACI|nr:PTS glucose transporter subunit IIA [Falsibacillus albus]RLQ96887.1 PTS glucose transporter subunit IIA [Falsibacillus albus]
MLSKLFRKTKYEQILAPVNGEVVSLKDVPDPVFSQGMMGEGVALQPNDGKVSAPVAGRVITAAKTKHAVGIRTDAGNEILVHVGIDTVLLRGEGFELLVKEGEYVQARQPILHFSLDFVKNNAKSILIPIVVTNIEHRETPIEFLPNKRVNTGEPVMKVAMVK